MPPWYDDPEPSWRQSLQTPAEWQKVARTDPLKLWLGTPPEPAEGVVLGVRKGPGSESVIAVPDEARSRHFYIVGASGSGKTTLLSHMIRQDMEQGKGCAVIDPLGQLMERVLPLVPQSRIADTLYFDPTDDQHPISLNPFVAETEQERERIAENFIVLFKRLFNVEDAPRLLHILRHVVRTLLESGHKTLLDIDTLLLDEEFRTEVLAGVRHPALLKFWKTQFPKYPKNAFDPILNKISSFGLSSIRRIFDQPNSNVDFAEIMRAGQLFFAHLPESKLGLEDTLLLGAVLTSMLQLATMRRGPARSTLFTLYVDEFQSVLGSDTTAFQKILSQARNYHVSLVLAHQHLSQIPKELRSAILGNVHTIISFRLGVEDARLFQAAFADAIPDKTAPKFAERLQNLAIGDAIVRYETATNNFLMRTYPPQPTPTSNFVREVIEHSRKHYGRRPAEAPASRPSPPADNAPPKQHPVNGAPPPPQPETKTAEAPPPHDTPETPPPAALKEPPIDPWKARKKRRT